MVDLPKRKLGRTGLDVTALGFGALELRGMLEVFIARYRSCSSV